MTNTQPVTKLRTFLTKGEKDKEHCLKLIKNLYITSGKSYKVTHLVNGEVTKPVILGFRFYGDLPEQGVEIDPGLIPGRISLWLRGEGENEKDREERIRTERTKRIKITPFTIRFSISFSSCLQDGDDKPQYPVGRDFFNAHFTFEENALTIQQFTGGKLHEYRFVAETK